MRREAASQLWGWGDVLIPPYLLPSLRPAHRAGKKRGSCVGAWVSRGQGTRQLSRLCEHRIRPNQKEQSSAGETTNVPPQPSDAVLPSQRFQGLFHIMVCFQCGYGEKQVGWDSTGARGSREGSREAVEGPWDPISSF